MSEKISNLLPLLPPHERVTLLAGGRVITQLPEPNCMRILYLQTLDFWEPGRNRLFWQSETSDGSQITRSRLFPASSLAMQTFHMSTQVSRMAETEKPKRERERKMRDATGPSENK